MIIQNRNEITAVVNGRTRQRRWPSTSGTRRRNGASSKCSWPSGAASRR
jgi:hypothetical protein